MAGYPDLNVISNVGRSTPPRSVFHVDTSYVRCPPTYTALRAVTIPEHGGETLFTNQYRAFETLPPEVHELLDGRTVRHVMTGLTLGDDAETEAEHPIFHRHPISGRTALYLSTPERCVAISGMDDIEGRDAIEFLYLHSIEEDNVSRHSWAAGDVVIWDNRCVLHRADHDGVVGDRVLHRGMVTGHAEHDYAVVSRGNESPTARAGRSTRTSIKAGRRHLPATRRPLRTTVPRGGEVARSRMLALLLAALPVNAGDSPRYGTAPIAESSSVTRRHGRGELPSSPMLVSGGKMTKSLHLARSFHAAGHRVVLAESAESTA